METNLLLSYATVFLAVAGTYGGDHAIGESEIAAAWSELELDDIQVMEGVEFRWKGDNGKGERRRGMICDSC